MSHIVVGRLDSADQGAGAGLLRRKGALAFGRLDFKAPRLPDLSDAGCRTLDLILTTLALIFLAGLLAAVALAVWLQDGGPVLFAHTRVGKDGRSFGCLKFRTMVTDADARLQALLDQDPAARAEWDANHKLKKDCRVTPLGAFLRRSSLDELPQLLNVLRGEMSLVGPRPIIATETSKYGKFFKNYCSVQPGITGLWQISGRCDTSYRRRVIMDVLYIRRRSMAYNCWIILSTFPAVLLQRGAY